MDDFFRLNPAAGGGSGELHHHHHHQVQANTMAGDGGYRVGTNHDDHVLLFDQTAQGMGSSSSSSSSHHHMSDLMKTQIANHPRFPELLAAYLECQKVGAPPETKYILEQMGGLSHPLTNCSEIGADPELDDFMQTYTEVLRKYKEELTKPFDEATEFLSNIQTQLSNLCNGTSDDYHSDEGAGSSEEEVSIGEVEEAAAAAAVAATESLDIFGGGPIADQDLKDMLLRKYSGYLSGLRKEFQKKRKKGKLPRAARIQLMEWWTTHYRWPYPTEEEKVKLSEITKLDQKQINNWFINQRKRHWKPSEDMRYALFEGVIGGAPPPMVFDAAAAAPGVGNANINHRR